MRRSILIAAIALTAAGLSACQDRDRPVAGICKAFPNAEAAPAATDGAAVMDDCLHRWAYTLAAGRDDAALVADGVMAACTAPLSRWNQQSLAAAAGAPQEAQSLLTGEPTNPIVEHANFAKDRSLFYVIQARAGGCKPPPRRDGQAPMTTPEK